MDNSSLAVEVPPIPRRSRERLRDRDYYQGSTNSFSSSNNNVHASSSGRRNNIPQPISTTTANRDRSRSFFRRGDRDRDRDRDQYGERPVTGDSFREKLLPPASPEVISSLITSLSVISRPVSQHFDSPSYLDPGLRSALSQISTSPTQGGSFGVDYGAFSRPTPLVDLKEEDIPLGELAASPPVIRTAKPPSRLSAITAPKSPRSPSHRENSGLKSLLSRASSTNLNGASRPSSRGSLTSAAESIGNVSVERGASSPVPPDSARSPGQSVRHRESHDSWGKKPAGGRGHRGLMYMSSRERLRENEEKKRLSGGGTAAGGSGGANGLLAAGVTRGSMTSRTDAGTVLAESVINEEPHSPVKADEGRSASLGASPRHIPARDSSLRKTGPNAKRSSARMSRTSKRDSDTIHEIDEQGGGSGGTSRNHTRSERHGSRLEPEYDLNSLQRASRTLSSFSRPDPGIYSLSPSALEPPGAVTDDIDEGAPSPNISQSRRRDRDSSAEGRANRRRSGRQTPDMLSGYNSSGYTSEGGGGMTVRLKRSSSKLKRLSGAASPTPEKRKSEVPGSSPAAALAVKETGSNTQSDGPHIAYERPRSADSIDDAVESYLCSPRLSQKIRHPQTGRVISFSEVGDPSGSAVFCCVGMGLTRYITAFYDELALTLKLRLITPDRPGVGDSEAYADGTATPLGWPDDVYAICQALKITKFSIIAHSAGAIYALATALRMPQHIRGRIHLLAPWIPPSQMSVFGSSEKTPLPPQNAIPTSQRILRALPTPILKAANSSFMTATSSSITSSLPKQKRTKRERKSNNAAKDAKATKNAAAATPDNKENEFKDGPPQIPADIGLTASENMDQIRPTGHSPSPGPIDRDYHASGNGGASSSASNHHRHARSNSSTQAARRALAEKEKSERILSAAAQLANSQLADRERQQTYDERLTHAIWQLATTGANPAVDLLVCLERRHTIGFRYVDITRPVVIHHGTKDTRVPVENVRWLGKTMRRCEVRILEGEGHGLMASAQVMGGVLMEVSREWEEWGRVTGQTKREREREEREGRRERRGTIGQAR